MAIKRFSKDEINKANNVSIANYINSLNLNTQKVGSTIKVEGYGGLYINPMENKWNCFSQEKGGGIIQLVMFIENKSWVEAVKILLGDSYGSKEVRNRAKNVRKVINEEDREFILPKRNKTFNHIIAYLIKTRKIDKEIVYRLIGKKMLYEDENRNCVFVGYDKKDNPKYASIRGTNSEIPFKGEVKNSNKSYSFNIPGITNKLYIFESPIETISYLTLQKEFSHGHEFRHHILSLGGLATVGLNQYLEDNTNIKEIYICLNNDKWGIAATNKIRKSYQDKYKVEAEYPISKDYNEDLQNYIRTMRIETKETIEEDEEFQMEI